MLGVALFAAAEVAQADTMFSDGTFNNADWTGTKILDPGGNASFTAFQVASGGNPGSFREVTQTLHETPIGVSHLDSAFVYDPSTQGAITSITVNYSLIEFSPLNGFEVAYGILAFQDGTYYITPTDNLNQSSWTNFSHSGLTAADFSNNNGFNLPGFGPATPNFSSSGGPIEFGFFTGNTPTALNPFTTNSGIDNFSITLQTVPEPASLTLLSIGLAALAARRRRVRQDSPETPLS